jgi:hypothetical protein
MWMVRVKQPFGVFILATPAKPVMQRFNAVGLPAYVILKPKDPA